MGSYLKNALLFLVFAIIGFVALAWYLRGLPTQNLSQSEPSTQNSTSSASFSLDQAPSQTIRAQITAMQGEVTWQSRTATVASEITTPVSIQQGESLNTLNSGTLTLSIPPDSTLTLAPKTSMNIIQLLPSSLVLQETTGTVTYKKSEESETLAVRSLHLLAEFTSCLCTISINSDIGTVTISVASGSAAVAYNDIDGNGKLITVRNNRKLIYDDDTRTARFLK